MISFAQAVKWRLGICYCVRGDVLIFVPRSWVNPMNEFEWWLKCYLKRVLSSVSKNVVNQTRYKNSRALESTIHLVQNRVALFTANVFWYQKMNVYFEVYTEVNEAKLSLLKLQQCGCWVLFYPFTTISETVTSPILYKAEHAWKHLINTSK